MKLLTKEILKSFEAVSSQEHKKDPIVIVKYFNPTGAGTWYATEYYPEERIFFGYAEILEGEWGYFSLDELESFKGRFGLGIERELYCEEYPISKILRQKDNPCGCV